jgi:beta-fructofuranosidase
MIYSTVLFGASLLACAFAQTSTYVEPTVPTGTPIAGNYTGALRPQIHYSPPTNFMNDPNGMFYLDGTWHLYYQYDATGLVAGNQHWGHATSQDLYHWTNQPIALFPPNNFTYVFSGSAVVDVNNTSGFFPNQTNGVVAIYTLAEYPGGVAGPQQQAISYSTDGGYTFTSYSGNPVIPSTSSQFRDPKVIWYEDHWVLVLAYAQDFTVGFFTSPDLKNWTHASNFSHHGLLGLQYECPNLVEMPIDGTGDTMYVLQISINPGAPLGGSISQYFPGYFNGTTFEAVDGVARINDFGKDNYAGQFFYGLPAGSDAVSIGWASNWQYSQIVPTGPREGWRSSMSLPRRNYLTNITRVGWDMVSLPYDISPVLGDELASNSSLGNGTIFVDYSTVDSNALYFEVNVTGINTTTISASATLNFTFSSPVSNEYLQGGFFFGGDTPFFINRGGVRGFDNVFFTDKFSTANLISENGTWSMIGVIDRSIFESFLDGGTRSATVTFFPNAPLTQMTLSATDILDGMTISVSVSAINSAWATMENEQGTVVGNITDGSANAAKRGMAYNAQF